MGMKGQRLGKMNKIIWWEKRTEWSRKKKNSRKGEGREILRKPSKIENAG